MDEDTVLVLATIGCTVFIFVCICGFAIYKEYRLAQQEDKEYYEYENMI